jgi:putative addiction module component (TIGR02574 family)
MSFAGVLQELPTLTFEQRQVIIRNAIELDNAPLNKADEALVESRLAAHRDNPKSGLTLEEMKVRVRSHYRK